ncbi:hypothetical protein [Taklimakanibacter albus]|uniref:Uncharacterized protein n=1 Tax=Taklimakanibacter albus TaxID=2800327 RepID=A0ACC5QWB2_9HYPH|nr:hypothetical protein [Aestuariivirga sp. YIM B02566]MBK1864720.1 hypothetical protein [Aestuariivirga sp. YIM B02566]
MQHSLPKESPQPVFLARARAGFDLPVIDVTHPRFAIAEDEAALIAMKEAFQRDHRQRRFIPHFLLRFMIRQLAKRSRLAAALFTSRASYLDSLSTYAMKLGPENLVPPYDHPADRRFAASPHVKLLRLRMQQVAGLMAEAIAGDDAFHGEEPLHLIDIAGGPALDAINALILLRQKRPELLRRAIAIHVLDRNPDGAFFGANALAALTRSGGPLSDLDISFTPHDYDWSDTSPLAKLLVDIKASGGVIGASSEGGLFEYGSDDAIIDNLRILHDGVRFVAGSVTNDDEIRRRMIAMSGFKVIPRGLRGFAPLAQAAHYEIIASRTALLSEQVLLRPC